MSLFGDLFSSNDGGQNTNNGTFEISDVGDYLWGNPTQKFTGPQAGTQAYDNLYNGGGAVDTSGFGAGGMLGTEGIGVNADGNVTAMDGFSANGSEGGIFNGLLSKDDGSMNWKGVGSAINAITGIFGGIANWNAMKDNRKMINNNIKFGKANLFNKGTSINNQMDAHQTMFNQNNPNMTNNPYENMTRMKTDTKQVA